MPRPSRSGILATACTTATIALLTAFTAPSLTAQAQIQCFYPLLTDLLDLTNNLPAASLLGTPPPAQPNNGVCLSGVYFFSAPPGGQDIRTPLIPNLNTTDFEINVEFNLASLPANQAPVIMGGNSYRWLGIYVMANGTVGIKHNNSNHLWSTTTILSTGIWYSASLKYELGTVVLFINGALALQAAVGPLNDGNNKNIVTNDYSNGLAFHGCIRNLLVLNDTSILATATAYGTGCSGSAGVPALMSMSNPQLGATFTLHATSLPPTAGVALLSSGFSRTSSALGPLPLDLQPFGLGAGCSLLMSADATILINVSGGMGMSSLGVPNNPGMTGLWLFFQCASFDLAATGGLALSNGVAASVGF